MPNDIEIDRLLNLTRSKLSFVTGLLLQTHEGLDPAEIGGLSFILSEVLESIEAVHRLAKESWGVPG